MSKNSFYFFILFVALLKPALGAISPAYYYQKLLEASVGTCSCIIVDEPKPISGSNTMNIVVHACSNANALGLSALLKSKWGSDVSVEIQNTLGSKVSPSAISTLAELENFIQLAFNNNPLFIKTIKTNNPRQPSARPGGIVMEWQKAVVQFWSDDINDYYGRTNLVAAMAFKYVLKDKFLNGIELGHTTE